MKKNIGQFIQKIRQYLTEETGVKTQRLFLFSVCSVIAITCFVMLIGYGADYVFSSRTSRELRAKYDAIVTEEPALSDVITFQVPDPETTTPYIPPTDSLASSDAMLSEMPIWNSTPEPETVLPSLLPEQEYPDNPERIINSNFHSIRKENKDIIGWLTIDRQIDEAVVQRDHVYYLDHDAMLNQNVNGAIFLDAAVSLDEGRPYSFILYGHNMKTGMMFGWLRNYENINFYHNNPWVHFNTIYEDGKYVVFAVGTISTTPGAENYLDMFSMTSRNREDQQKAINTLINESVHTCTIDVEPSDQLRILVTCVDSDDERRVVAARRIRDGESKEDLQQLVNRSRHQNIRHR